MKGHFFNKSLQKKCEYCAHGNKISFSGDIICKFKGVVDNSDCCRKYKYDPLKREPGTKIINCEYTKDDFSL